MATQQQGVWGVDLGQCALKALRVELIDEQVQATHFDFVEHPKILSQPDADPDQLTREAMEKFLSRNKVRGDIVAISVPGQSGLARFVKLPPVEEKKINDIVKFEAKQQIPFPLDEVVWDYQKIGSGQVTDGFAMETEIGLFAMKRDMINRYLTHFQDVKVEVHLVQMAPSALCNYLAYDLLGKEGKPGEGGQKPGKTECVVALDIGADNSNLVITDGERIIWQRPIPLGGNHFTRALTKDMKLTFAKAEHLKRNAAKSPDLKKILTALKPVLNDFVGEVQRSLGYFTSTHRAAEVQYMMGLGSAFRLPGLQKYLSEKLQIEVRKPAKFQRLGGDEVVSQPNFTENVLTFPVAYGLALQGLRLSRLQTNLLPKDIQFARMVRAKKPFAVAAAASLLMGCSVMAMGYGCQKNTYAHPVIQDEMTRGKEVMGKVDNWKSKADEKEKAITDNAQAVKNIVSGREEQLNWLKFTNFLNDSLPRPDCSNLKLPRQDRFRSGREEGVGIDYHGDTAYEKYLERQAGKLPPDDTSELDSLVEVNLEAVNAMYCDDLGRFLETLKRGTQEVNLATMRKDELAAAAGKGWVIEIRGFTYHKGRRQFIIDTIVRNLQAKGAKPKPVAAAPGDTPPAADPMMADPMTAAAADVTKPTEVKEPVIGNISHVVLYKYKPVENPVPGSFELISMSELGRLATGTQTAFGGGDAMGGPGSDMGLTGRTGGDTSMPPTSESGSLDSMGAAPMGRVKQWSPLGGTRISGSAGVMGGDASSIMPGAAGPGSGPGPGFDPRSGDSRTGSPDGRSAPATPEGYNPGPGMDLTGRDPFGKPLKPRKAQFARSEFIIVLVWKEPVSPTGEEVTTEETPETMTDPATGMPIGP